MIPTVGAHPVLAPLVEEAAREERLGNWDASAQLYARVFRRALGEGEPVQAVNALRGQGRVRREQGRYEEAAELVELSREIAEAHGLMQEAARALNVLGIIRYAERKWSEAAELYERARELAVDLGDDELVGLVCQNLGVLSNMQGQMRDARIHYLESIASCIRSGNKRNELTIYNNLGLVCTDLREWMEAELYFDRGIEIAERIGDGAHIALLLANRADPLIRTGEFGRARETLARAEEAARTTSNRVALADVARFRGSLARAEGDHGTAMRHLDEALALAAGDGLEYERAEALAELGVLQLEQGRAGEAAESLRTAREIFRSLGALGDARTAERLLEGTVGER